MRKMILFIIFTHSSIIILLYYIFRLSRGRQTIECAFGILSGKWRIFRKPIQTAVTTVESIVKACVCLHNFVLDRDCNPLVVYFKKSDNKDNGLVNLARNQYNRPADNPLNMRNTLKDLFLRELAIPWQINRAFRPIK
jgi:hypothetical protein